MNAPLRPDATPRLEDFPYRLTDNVRFADLDPNQHVNNAVYATYFETGRVTLMKDRSYGLMPDGVTWIMVRLDIISAPNCTGRADRIGTRRRQVRPHLGDASIRWCFPRQMRRSAQRDHRRCSMKPRASRRR